MKTTITLIISAFIFSTDVCAQFVKQKMELISEFPLTGNLYFDSNNILSTDSASFDWKAMFFDERKSPFKAAVYSALIPGLGELYTESYWTAATFFTAEVLLLSTSIYYENLANQREDEFEAIANDPVNGWFVDKYARYLIDYNEGTLLSNNLKNAMGSSYLAIGNPGNRSWWGALNALERESTYSNGQKFSHVLPSYDSQQYYELIGKYNQFSPGWWDHENANGLTPSASFLAYRDLRSKANDIHDLASNLMIGVFINHAASAINAAVQANWYNKNTRVSLRQQSILMKKAYLAQLTVNF